MKQLISLFTEYTGKNNPNIEALPTSGSNRKYYRLQQDEISLIGVNGESIEENSAFIHLARHFHKNGLNVPKVVAVSDDKIFYLQQDLGDSILFIQIKEEGLTVELSLKEKDLLIK